MGVKGLRKFLSETLKGVTDVHRLPMGATLVIDGDGWLWHICSKVQHLNAELGGCYDEFDKALQEEIKFLRGCGLNLVIFFDGPCKRMKEIELSARKEDRKEEYMSLYDYFEEGSILPDRLPLPVMLFKQFEVSIRINRHLFSKIVYSKVEADQEIAKFVRNENSKLGDIK